MLFLTTSDEAGDESDDLEDFCGERREGDEEDEDEGDEVGEEGQDEKGLSRVVLRLVAVALGGGYAVHSA